MKNFYFLLNLEDSSNANIIIKEETLIPTVEIKEENLIYQQEETSGTVVRVPTKKRKISNKKKAVNLHEENVEIHEESNNVQVTVSSDNIVEETIILSHPKPQEHTIQTIQTYPVSQTQTISIIPSGLHSGHQILFAQPSNSSQTQYHHIQAVPIHITQTNPQAQIQPIVHTFHPPKNYFSSNSEEIPCLLCGLVLKNK
jgi:hypothetical protein